MRGLVDVVRVRRDAVLVDDGRAVAGARVVHVQLAVGVEARVEREAEEAALAARRPACGRRGTASARADLEASTDEPVCSTTNRRPERSPAFVRRIGWSKPDPAAAQRDVDRGPGRTQTPVAGRTAERARAARTKQRRGDGLRPDGSRRQLCGSRTGRTSAATSAPGPPPSAARARAGRAARCRASEVSGAAARSGRLAARCGRAGRGDPRPTGRCARRRRRRPSATAYDAGPPMETRTPGLSCGDDADGPGLRRAEHDGGARARCS